jgi:WD40 repeat protein
MSTKRVVCITWWIGILTILGVACRSAEQITSTPQEQSAIETEIGSPSAPVESTLTATVPILITATRTITLRPTSSNTPPPTTVFETVTPLPTPSPLQKVAELPVSGTELAVSMDGSLLAASNTNTGILYVFDMAKQEVRWELEEDSRIMTSYTALSFSPNGNLLAGGGVNQDVFVWNMNSGELIYSLSVPHEIVDATSFTSDSRFLVISSFKTPTPNVEVTLWDMQTGQLANTYSLKNLTEMINLDIGNGAQSESPTWSVSDVAFLPNQDNVLAITIGHHVAQEDDVVWALYFWDVANQEIKEVLPGAFGRTLAVSPDGQLLAAEIDDELQVLDMPNETVVLSLDPEAAASTSRLALANTGLLARLERGGGVTLWNLEGDLLTTLITDKTISNIVFAPNGDLLIATYVDNNDEPIEVWRINEQQP